MSIPKTHQKLLLSSMDPDLLSEVEDIIGDETPKLCYQCNMCSSGCPVVDYMEYPPHMIMQMTRLGMAKQLLSSKAIWVCTLCLKCKERCPQQTSAVDAIWALRTIAIKRGYNFPAAYKAMTNQVVETGNIYEILDLTEEDRDDLDLPKIPSPTQINYRRLLEKTGIFEILSTPKNAETLAVNDPKSRTETEEEN